MNVYGHIHGVEVLYTTAEFRHDSMLSYACLHIKWLVFVNGRAN